MQEFTPWSNSYVLAPKPDECPCCIPEKQVSLANDEARLVLYRGRKAFVAMERFPYNSGHLLVAPYRHAHDFAGLDEETATELMDLMQWCTVILKRQFHCPAINIGACLGEAAGAPTNRAHLAFQVVPRWNGDSSFMAVLNEIRTMPDLLENMYRQLKPFFDRGPEDREVWKHL